MLKKCLTLCAHMRYNENIAYISAPKKSVYRMGGEKSVRKSEYYRPAAGNDWRAFLCPADSPNCGAGLSPLSLWRWALSAGGLSGR